MSVTHEVLNLATPRADVNRRLARDIALLLRAALLRRSSPVVFSAFCGSRLDGAADVFGLLPAGTHFDPILQRALSTLN